VPMGSKAGMCILGCKVVRCVQCGEMCEIGQKEWHFEGFEHVSIRKIRVELGAGSKVWC